MTDAVPKSTLDWLAQPENPAVAVMTRRELLGEPESAELDALWARRSEYAPVASILEQMLPDGTWAPPPRDYQKYWGSLWQIHFLGELYANGEDERVQRAAAYAFSRQLSDGSWSCSNMKPYGSIACLTANVARALARLGFSRDERVIAALEYVAELHHSLGKIDCHAERPYSLIAYCHMLTPKELLFLGEVPREMWPSHAEELRDACVAALRDKEIYRCLPVEAKEFRKQQGALPSDERAVFRERYLAEHEPLHYGDKPGWLKLGYPLSYNSDVLESLVALAGVGETYRPEYEAALSVVREAADAEMRWKLRTSFNGKMLADVEKKGQPSKWLTLRALRVLRAFENSEPTTA